MASNVTKDMNTAEVVSILVMTEVLDMLDAIVDLLPKCPCPSIQNTTRLRVSKFRSRYPTRESLQKDSQRFYVFGERKKVGDWAGKHLSSVRNLCSSECELAEGIDKFLNKYVPNGWSDYEESSSEEEEDEPVKKKATIEKVKDELIDLVTDSEGGVDEVDLPKVQQIVHDAQPLLAEEILTIDLLIDEDSSSVSSEPPERRCEKKKNKSEPDTTGFNGENGAKKKKGAKKKEGKKEESEEIERKEEGELEEIERKEEGELAQPESTS